MRRLLSVTLALATALVVLGIQPAVAGGPTSVLVVHHETGQSAAALNGSPAYTELQSILGDENPPDGGSTPPGVVTNAQTGIRLVWLIHDVSPWRIDTVHLAGADTWVETFIDTSGTDPYAGTPVWHRPARGGELVTTLTTLGVLGAGSTSDGAAPTAPTAPGADAAAVGTPEPADASAPGVSRGLAIAMVAVALVLGVGVGALLDRRVAPRVSTRRRVEALG